MGSSEIPINFLRDLTAKTQARAERKKDNTGLMDSVRKTLIKEQRNRWEQLCNKHLAKAYEFIHEPPPKLTCVTGKKRLKSKPINLTMKELRDTNIRQSYIDRLESKRNYEQAQAELEDAKIDYYTAEPPVAPKPKTKAPTPFDLPKPQPGPSKTKNEKK